MFISTSYALSLVILALAFSYYLDHYKINDVLYDVKYEFLLINDYDLILEYLDDLARSNSTQDIATLCEESHDALNSIQYYLRQIGTKLSRYGQSSTSLSEQDFDYLKREYYLLQLKEYFILRKVKNYCKNQNVTIILFFFKKNDDNSLIMGRVLSEVAISLNNTYVLSFDGEYEDVFMLNLLKKRYNITRKELPVFIINDRKYTELYNVDEVLKLIYNSKGIEHNTTHY